MFSLLERQGLCRAWFMLVVLRASVSLAGPGELRLEAQLLWGTDTQQPPGFPYQPAAPLIATKLRNMPFKWKHFYEVNRATFNLSPRAMRRVQLSAPCSLEIKNLGASRIEARLYGRKKLVNTIKQALSDGELAVIGGDDKGENAWLVILRIVDPK
jgi:hypothetical protein